jgi:RNA polymerase sigma-70 factor (ECF subfamily)
VRIDRGRLQELTEIAADLDQYQPFHAAHAELLARAGRDDAALAAYDRAIALSPTEAQVRFLFGRKQALGQKKGRA